MKTKISLATTTLALCLPLTNTSVMAGGAPPNPCYGIVESVEILGTSAVDAKAEITCQPSGAGPVIPTQSQSSSSVASCYTKNPLMIEAAADAALDNAWANLAWVTKMGVNWCTSFEIGLKDVD